LLHVQVIKVIKSTIHSNNEWYICKLLTNYILKRILPKGVSAGEYFESCDFSHENTNIETCRYFAHKLRVIIHM
jgi:predicted nuclease of restriction endonuclease-like (RecB) superfamily